jgi:hypothetical protein
MVYIGQNAEGVKRKKKKNNGPYFNNEATKSHNIQNSVIWTPNTHAY